MGNKTSVKWLIEKLSDSDENQYLWLDDKPDYMYALNKILVEANEKHRQDLKECWEAAHQAGRFEGKGIAQENWQTFENYYEEKFGGNDGQKEIQAPCRAH